LGNQDRFEHFLDDRLSRYEATMGQAALFGSPGYKLAESLALEDWRREQSHVPDDIVEGRLSGVPYDIDRAPLDPEGLDPTLVGTNIISLSRELNKDVHRPWPGDSKYDITKASITADVAAEFQKQGLESESEAMRYAGDAVDEWLKSIEKDIRESVGKDADAQTVRELVYRKIRVIEHISDIFDEWLVLDPSARENPPESVIDEALRRELEENGNLLPNYSPEQQGTLAALAGIAPEPLGAAIGVLAVPFDPVLEKIEDLFDEKWIPTWMTYTGSCRETSLTPSVRRPFEGSSPYPFQKAKSGRQWTPGLG
jgi:hypothetical protein